MKTRHIVGISALSSLLTVISIAVLLLTGSGAAIAQNPQPTAPPDAAAHYPDGVIPDPNTPVVPSTPDEAAAPEVVTEYLHYPGTAFHGVRETDIRHYTANGCVYLDGGTDARANLELTLPYNSTITYMRVYFRDGSDINGSLILTRYDDGGAPLGLDFINTAGNAPGLYTYATKSVSATVDYVNYSYALQWAQSNSGSAIELCGARIGFTRPSIFASALPYVRRQ